MRKQKKTQSNPIQQIAVSHIVETAREVIAIELARQEVQRQTELHPDSRDFLDMLKEYHLAELGQHVLAETIASPGASLPMVVRVKKYVELAREAPLRAEMAKRDNDNRNR
jgi:hypothetical protein